MEFGVVGRTRLIFSARKPLTDTDNGHISKDHMGTTDAISVRDGSLDLDIRTSENILGIDRDDLDLVLPHLRICDLTAV